MLVRVDKTEEATAGGILLPQNSKEQPKTATVVAVGEGRVTVNGTRIEIDLGPDERVFLFPEVGQWVDENERLLMVKEEYIFGVID